MAIKKFHNITGSTGVTVELIAPFSQTNDIKSMVIANIHATDNAVVTLFIEDSPTTGASSRFNIIFTITIPYHTSLVLSGTDIPTVPSSYGTYITVGGTDVVDVMINT